MRGLVQKLATSILILFSVVILVSSIVYNAPVDPTSLTFGQRSDQKTVESKRRALGLDLPLHQQLAYYLRDVSPLVVIDQDAEVLEYYNGVGLHVGEKLLMLKFPYLRESYQTDRSVSIMLAEAIPLTLLLALCSFMIAIVLGIGLGIIAGINHGNWIDKTIIAISTVGYSVPSYVSAIFLAVVFAFVLGEFTGLNVQGSLIEINDIGDDIVVLKNLLLPAIALGIRPISVVAQLMRSALLDTMSQDYVRTGKAKGLQYYTVVFRHVLRNAMNPVATSISGWLASLLAGAFFVENVFNYRGMGLVTVTALVNYDIPVILASIIFICGIFIIINILMDYVYAWLDPRVSVS